MLKHENTDVCRTWSTADAGVFCWGEGGSLQAACSVQKATQNVAGGSELSLLFFSKLQFKNLFDTVLADDTGYAGSNVLLAVFAIECG